MTRTRPGAFVAAAVVLLASDACFPQGNALGLEGTYRGVEVVDVDGTERTFSGGQTLAQDYESRTDAVTTYTVELGVQSDAVVSGARCPVSLKVFSSKLVLENAVECDAVHDKTTFATGGDLHEKLFEYQTIKIFEVEKSGDDKVRIYIDAELKTILQVNDEPTSEDERREKVTFEGTRIADEKN
ncbi:MAG: hypothetical protein ABIJ09_15125 [Pseudomonadota bacterium]